MAGLQKALQCRIGKAQFQCLDINKTPCQCCRRHGLLKCEQLARFVHMLVWCNIRQRRSSAEEFKYSTLQLDF